MSGAVGTNTGVFRHFGLDPADFSSLRPWDSGPDPYMGSGAHPDIVERLWKGIAPALPQDCRRRVGLVPALVHPRTLQVLAVALGTQYALRLTDEARLLARAAGAKTTTTWGAGTPFDLSAAFGPEWVFGAWLPQEPAWCRQAYDAQ